MCLDAHIAKPLDFELCFLKNLVFLEGMGAIFDILNAK